MNKHLSHYCNMHEERFKTWTEQIDKLTHNNYTGCHSCWINGVKDPTIVTVRLTGQQNESK